MDERAITYAKGVVKGLEQIALFEWETANVFWLDPSERYDLVWAAGLFDYLKERHAVALLRRMWDWTKDGGRLVFGNIHPRNPTRHYMEWCLAWYLVHRTREDMLSLCWQAGISKEEVSFQTEPLGIFCFCIIEKG
jgi:cyclopropane fatty-acyl-phospholipid synthase-like methyltransferase